MFKAVGIMCTINGALPIDAGTLTPGSSQPRRIVNAAQPNSASTLLGDCRATVESWYRNDQTHVLARTLALRDQMERQRQQAANELGAGRPVVRELKELVDFLDALIAEARSTRGIAAQRLGELAAQVRASPASRDTAGINKALIEWLKGEAERQKQGGPDPFGPSAMEVVADVVNAVADASFGEFEALVKAAEAGDAGATDEKMHAAVVDVFGLEKQRMLMGLVDDNAPSPVMGVFVRAMTVSVKRRHKELVDLVAAARRPASTVTNAQLMAKVSELFGAEHSALLAGADENSDWNTLGGPVADVVNVIVSRQRVTVSQLLDRAANPNSGVTREQISTAIGASLGILRNSVMLGSGQDAELDALVTRAIELRDSRPPATTRGESTGRIIVELGVPTITRQAR